MCAVPSGKAGTARLVGTLVVGQVVAHGIMHTVPQKLGVLCHAQPPQQATISTAATTPTTIGQRFLPALFFFSSAIGYFTPCAAV